jgi:hypothetical protein
MDRFVRVRGSELEGHCVSPSSSGDRDVIIEIARQCFPDIARAAAASRCEELIAYSKPFTGPRFLITVVDDEQPFSVRLTAHAVPGDAARAVFSPHRCEPVDLLAGGTVMAYGTWVIQLSDRIDGQLHEPISWHSIQRALCRELAYILAKRQEISSGNDVSHDALRFGHRFPVLSARDRALVAELEYLATRDRRDEIAAIIDHAGLRNDTDGSAARRELVSAAVSGATQAIIEELCRPVANLPDRDRDDISRIRDLARQDLEQHVVRVFYERPIFPAPTMGDCAIGMVHAHEHARGVEVFAEHAEAFRIARTPVSGSRRWRSPMIGGGAALAARRPDQLVVDRRGRWQRDPSPLIAQTARELEEVRLAGLGNPLEFAALDQRVPVAALRFWENAVAALGPFIEGDAVVETSADGSLAIRIAIASGGTTVEPFDGVLTVATGFPPERIIGLPPSDARLPTTLAGVVDLLRVELQRAPVGMSTAGGNAAALAHPTGAKWGDAREILEASRALGLLAQLPSGRAEYVESFLLAAANWSVLRLAHERLLLADEVSDDRFRERIERDPAGKWIIVGLGGSAVSAAEVISRLAPRAEIDMLGEGFTAGLRNNQQYQWLEKSLGGRLRAQGGLKARRLEQHGDGLRVVMTRGSQEMTFDSRLVVVALGRGGQLPSAIESLVFYARWEGHEVRFEPIMDESAPLYLGYAIHVNGHEIHVIGAASRFLPLSLLTQVELEELDQAVEIARDRDAPPESGNFDGGFSASAMQAARYARWRRSRGHDHG